MNAEKVKKIFEMSKERFPDAKEHYSFLMEQLQIHMIEVDDLKNDRNDHYLKEIADLAILGKLLAHCEDVDDSIFEERYKRFIEKIKENK